MFKLNQKGVSLPIVMAVSALILANMVYFIELNKDSKKKNVLYGAHIAEQSEEGRIGAFLADLGVCTSNFAGVNPDSYTSASPFPSTKKLEKNTISFLEVGGKYLSNSHVVKNFYFYSDLANTNDNTKYSLVVVYDILDTGVADLTMKSNIPKKSSRVEIPLYIEKTGTNIARCYARPYQDLATTGSTVELAVQAACKTTALTPANQSNTNNIDVLNNLPSVAIQECLHNVAPDINMLCAQAGMLNKLTIDTNGGGNVLGFSCQGLILTCPTNDQQLFKTITNSSAASSCSTPTTPCSGGSAFIAAGSGSVACSQQCPSNRLWSSVDTTGNPTCYERSGSCPAGEYVKEVRADNTVVCNPVTHKNKYCTDTVNQYVTSINQNMYSGNPFTPCTNYSKVKTQCAGRFNFVSNFGTPTPTCRTFTY